MRVMKLLLILSLFLCFSSTFSKSIKKLKVNYNVTDVEYDSIPPVYKLDDYDKCRREIGKNLYCFTKIQLAPSNREKPSRTWEIIEEIISSPRNFRHDILRYGICIQKRCPNIPKEYYTIGNGTEELWKELSKCYSVKYKSMGLKAQVIEVTCNNENPIFQVDAVDILYLLVIILILVLVLGGTAFEAYARFGDPKDYENLTTSTKGRQILTAFSVLKNWERLRSEVPEGESKSLSVFQGVRVANTYFVILSHTSLVLLVTPIVNTKYFEDATLDVFKMFLANGSLICQTFFIISGWLLSYTLCILYSDKKIKLNDLLKVFLFRCIRLVPLMLLTLGFHATWLRHIGDGPMWEFLIGMEYKKCRANWYTNALFLNNYWKNDNMCLEQSWYMAADTQLFILGLFVMMMVLNNRQHAKKIFAFWIIFGIAITFVDIYVNDYDAVMRSYPESVLKLYLDLDEWLYVLIPGHLSISCYVQGLLCGYYFYKYKKEKKEFLTNRILLWGWFAFLWIMPISTILSAFYFYHDGYEHSSLLTATFQAFSRYMFGLPISLALFGFAMGKGGYMYSFCNWGPLQTLGRMSYSVFLVHSSVLFARGGLIRTINYVNDFKIFTESLGDFVLSYAAATVVCVCLEMPLSKIQKILFFSREKKNVDETKEKIQ